MTFPCNNLATPSLRTPALWNTLQLGEERPSCKLVVTLGQVSPTQGFGVLGNQGSRRHAKRPGRRGRAASEGPARLLRRPASVPLGAGAPAFPSRRERRSPQQLRRGSAGPSGRRLTRRCAGPGRGRRPGRGERGAQTARAPPPAPPLALAARARARALCGRHVVVVVRRRWPRRGARRPGPVAPASGRRPCPGALRAMPRRTVRRHTAGTARGLHRLAAAGPGLAGEGASRAVSGGGAGSSRGPGAAGQARALASSSVPHATPRGPGLPPFPLSCPECEPGCRSPRPGHAPPRVSARTGGSGFLSAPRAELPLGGARGSGERLPRAEPSPLPPRASSEGRLAERGGTGRPPAQPRPFSSGPGVP